MTSTKALRAFISYSHHDEPYLNQLHAHLSTLRRQGVISVWYDREISAGRELDEAIRKELEAADIIILLISAQFIDSDYCYGIELKRALERHEKREARVIPVIVRRCDWKPILGHLMATPADGKPASEFQNPDEGYFQVSQAIRRVANEVLQQTAPVVAAAPQTARPSPEVTRRAGVNVKIRREYSDQDRDEYLTNTFASVLALFQESAPAIEAGEADVKMSVRSIDADQFTAQAYVGGKSRATCRIWLVRDHHGGEIRFSYNLGSSDNSWNESVHLSHQRNRLVFEPIGMQFTSPPPSKELDASQTADYLWALFREHLER